MATNALLQLFKAKKPAFGAWLTVPGLFHARSLARASPHLSWVVIDCEHGLVPLMPGAAESTIAIEGAGPTPIIRIPATGTNGSTSWQIKNALDAGARGVLVPMVSSAEKAREIVADSKLPPIGRRGYGSPFTHGIWGISAKQYLETANDNVLVMVQIETKEGVEKVHEIAQVEGIESEIMAFLDVLFIGPYDLSMSLGYPPPSPDPDPNVEKVIEKILKAAHAAGKKCAIYCISGAQAAKRAEQGFDMINVTSDVGAMSDAVASHFNVAVGSSKNS